MPPEAGPTEPGPWAATYLEVAGSFADLVAALPQALTGPGLGEWDLRALVGHTARSLVTVSEYLRRPAASVECESAAHYVAGLAAATADPGVARRGVEAGEMLGDDELASITEELQRREPREPTRPHPYLPHTGTPGQVMRRVMRMGWTWRPTARGW